jgi:hypothetical protein
MLRSAGGSGDAAAAEEALGMLQQAAQLSAEHYGKQHPGGSDMYNRCMTVICLEAATVKMFASEQAVTEDGRCCESEMLFKHCGCFALVTHVASFSTLASCGQAWLAVTCRCWCYAVAIQCASTEG